MKDNNAFSLIMPNGDEIAISPLNSDGLKISGKREGQYIFFRRKLGSSIKLQTADYLALYELETSQDRCEEVKLVWRRKCGAGTLQPYWRGVFTASDCKFNYDACTVEFTPEPDDAYRTLLENLNRKYNVLAVPRAGLSVSAKLDITGNFEFKTITGDTIADQDDSDTWALFLRARNWIDGSFPQNGTREHNDIIFRLRRQAAYVLDGGVYVAPDLSRDGWKLINSDDSAKIGYYAKPPALYNFEPFEYGTKDDWYKYPTLLQINPSASFDAARYIEVSGPGGAVSAECYPNMEFRYYVDERRCIKLIWELGVFNFNRGRKLLDVIDYLVQQIAPASRAASPAAQSLFFSEPTNYVTKLVNDLVDLLIFQKTDVLSYNSSEAATKGEISLKDLLQNLQDMFKVYWFLDGSGKFRLEHISYFKDQSTFDFTQASRGWQRWLAGTRAYEYNKINMPRYERLLFNEAYRDDFAKSEIEYTSPCVNKKDGEDTAEVTISDFTTDLEDLLIGGTGDNKGFVLMAHRSGTVIKTAGAITGRLLPNAPLSAANLMTAFWRHERVMLVGNLNSVVTVFASTAKTRKQATITVPLCCETINPYAQYITTLGSEGSLDGWVEYSEKVEFTVMHTAPVDNTSGPRRSFDDSFSESFG